MKKYTLLFILAIIGINPLFAQKDTQAKGILDEVTKKYKSYDAIKTDFVFTLENPQANIKESQTGTLVAKSKSSKFKVTIYGKAVAGKPAVAQEIISDGKSQWTYLKKDNEVQVSDVDKSGEGLNPAQIFTIYEKGYKYLYTGDQKLNGKLCQVIELSPTDTKKSVFKVKLFIDKAQKQIYSALIFDKNGNKYNYTIKSFAANGAVPDNTFSFDTKGHPGVEVVDLR
ncbi:LolA family protein [Mucilaginibacter polytrichastri]|nr:outer membrane lipoprotein carrier protein LolA [Mucilaginibacter polytrichastri]